MRIGAGQAAEIGAVALPYAGHEETHRLRRRLVRRWLLWLLRAGRAGQRRQGKRNESELHGFHRFPKVVVRMNARPEPERWLDSKPLMSSRYLKETEGGMMGARA